MKILVLSLLRIGDLAMNSGLIWNLKKQYQNAELHVLLNDSCMKLTPLMPFVYKFHIFSRTKIQKLILDKESSFFEAYDVLNEEFGSSLSSISFDLSVNLTQNKLSAHIMGLINSKKKLGLTIDQNQRVEFGHPWFQYLNNVNHTNLDEIYHYIDIFKFALDQFSLESRVKLMETSRGQLFAEDMLFSFSDKKKRVAIQPFSSDSRKDWNLLLEFISYLHQLSDEYEFLILGAPFEQERVSQFQKKLNKMNVNSHICICDLENVYSVLKRVDGIVTCDTSIKHMASALNCKIVEISTGSSNIAKTGVYKKDSLILTSKESCYPCSHFKDCSKTSYLCQENLSAIESAKITHFYFNDDYHKIHSLLHKSTINAYTTQFSTNNRWILKRLTDKNCLDQNINKRQEILNVEKCK